MQYLYLQDGEIAEIDALPQNGPRVAGYGCLISTDPLSLSYDAEQGTLSYVPGDAAWRADLAAMAAHIADIARHKAGSSDPTKLALYQRQREIASAGTVPDELVPLIQMEAMARGITPDALLATWLEKNEQWTQINMGINGVLVGVKAKVMAATVEQLPGLAEAVGGIYLGVVAAQSSIELSEVLDTAIAGLNGH